MIPELPATSDAALAALVELCRGRRIVALTGAGCSTESGIPDYRGEGTRARARNPIRFDAYVRDAEARTRYWVRSLIGWPKLAGAAPNPAHRSLAALERQGRLVGLITQNVDRLHQAAGSREVVELHGALAEVRCLGCGALEERHALQQRLLAQNPGWLVADASLAPDGDADFEAGSARALEFRVCDCSRCGGLLKPNVVFFGEAVPLPVVERASALVERAELLLVLGSSLAVFSGLRFVKRAHAAGIPVAIVNAGPTRGDELAALKLDARVGELLPRLVAALDCQL